MNKLEQLQVELDEAVEKWVEAWAAAKIAELEQDK